MKITVQFPAGHVALFENGAWSCAHEISRLVCEAATRRHSARLSARNTLTAVVLMAGRQRAQVKIELTPQSCAHFLTPPPTNPAPNSAERLPA